MPIHYSKFISILNHRKCNNQLYHLPNCFPQNETKLRKTQIDPPHYSFNCWSSAFNCSILSPIDLCNAALWLSGNLANSPSNLSRTSLTAARAHSASSLKYTVSLDSIAISISSLASANLRLIVSTSLLWSTDSELYFLRRFRWVPVK